MGVELLIIGNITWQVLLGAASVFPFKLGLVAGGLWLYRSDIGTERWPRIGGWTVAGGAGFLVVNLMTMPLTPDLPTIWFVAWARWSISIGSAVGFAIGTIEARSIERAVAAEQAAVSARYLEYQREWLDYLNAVLRHEVLNNANVIGGYTALLLEEREESDPDYAHLRTIERQSREMTHVIRDVRTLLETLDDGPTVESTALAPVLRGELDALDDQFDEVRIDAEIPNDVTVEADDLLPRLFSNLLTNAVEHNDSSSPLVRVTVERTDETVRVRIEDDGPGIPDDELEDLFERDDDRRHDHGIGLYIVRRLTDRYRGRVEVTETGPDGTVITVELPRAREGPDLDRSNRSSSPDPNRNADSSRDPEAERTAGSRSTAVTRSASPTPPSTDTD
ncbi:sensor histidine kinase [Natrialbaceae archaeon GCM10025810]|uniref:sensor histidine kinase n=1 Tax=Halovalidus salilacus TaxID=3075124 RepID=UPI003613B67C